MDRADGGEILTTDTVRQLVGTMTEASFRDRGRVALKGFAERQRLYEVRPAEARPAEPPAPRGPPRRSRRTRMAAGAVASWRRAAAADRRILDAGPDRRPRSSVVAQLGGRSSTRAREPWSATIGGGREPGSRSRPGPAGSGCSTRTAPRSRTSMSRNAQARRDEGDRRVDGAAAACRATSPRRTAGRVAQRRRVQRQRDRRDPPRGQRRARAGRTSRAATTCGWRGPCPPQPSRAPRAEAAASSPQGTAVWAATNGPDGMVRIDYDPVVGSVAGDVGPAPARAAWALATGGGCALGHRRRQAGRHADRPEGRAPGLVGAGWARIPSGSPSARVRCGWPTRATTRCRGSIPTRTWSRTSSVSARSRRGSRPAPARCGSR